MSVEFVGAIHREHGAAGAILSRLFKDVRNGIENGTITSYPDAKPPFATISVNDLEQPQVFSQSYEADPRHAQLVVQLPITATGLLDAALREKTRVNTRHPVVAKKSRN